MIRDEHTKPETRTLKRAHCTERWTRLPAACVLALGLLLACHAWSQSTPPTPADAPETATEAPTPEKPSEPPPPPEDPLYQSREDRDMHLLANDMEGETVVWLEAKGQPFLALYEQELTGNAVGAVLILNAEGQHSSWPNSSERIRLSFPEFGWSSLSTELPGPTQEQEPERDWFPIRPPLSNSSTQPGDAPSDEADSKKSDEKSAEGEKEGAKDAAQTEPPPAPATPPPAPSEPAPEAPPPDPGPTPEELSLARVEAAISYLHQRGQFNIVLLGEGIGALRAACFINTLPKVNTTTQSRLVRALILIDARNQTPAGEERLYKCLRDREIPVLDIYIPTSDENLQEAKTRLKHARRNGLAVYQQIKLPEMGSNTLLGENRLSRRIRGFMESHAKGVKVDNAIIRQP